MPPHQAQIGRAPCRRLRARERQRASLFRRAAQSGARLSSKTRYFSQAAFAIFALPIDALHTTDALISHRRAQRRCRCFRWRGCSFTIYFYFRFSAGLPAASLASNARQQRPCFSKPVSFMLRCNTTAFAPLATPARGRAMLASFALPLIMLSLAFRWPRLRWANTRAKRRRKTFRLRGFGQDARQVGRLISGRRWVGQISSVSSGAGLQNFLA